jgi:hypothetical protein
MPKDPPRENLIALRDARERAIARLSDAFAQDLIDVEEFERRLAIAHRAEVVADIEALVADVMPPAEAPPAAAPLAVATPGATGLSGEWEGPTLAAIFGGVERRGRWTVPPRLRAVVVFGGAVLDLREASLSPGVTEIDVRVVMGGVQIIVPAWLAVEVSGSAVMGGFAHLDRVPLHPDPDRPVLRVHGLAILGGVAVETRLPGESDRDAERRRRRAHRALPGDHRPRLPRKAGD